MSNKYRPVIGIMTGHYLSDYPRTIISELWRGLKDMNVDLRLYSGVNANIVFSHRLAEIDNSKDIYEAYDEGFGLHWLSMFEYSHFDDLDLLIICYGNILASHPYNKTADLLSLLPDVPKIILGTNLDMENVVCVTMDNYGPMKAGISHLIEKHNKKDIAFISGPKVSQSANKRMEAYLDALDEHDLPIRDSLIAFGDYLNNIDDIVEDLFSRNDHIDAIVSSNDEMCNAIYRVAEKLGRKIGVDLAVIGFDDAPFAATMNPPLTTIHQDYHIEAEGAIGLVKDYLSGNKLSSIVFPARLVIRESCGCQNIPAAPDNGNLPKNTYIQYEELYKTQIQNLSAAVTLRNLLLDSVNRKAFFETLAKEMIIADTPSSYVFLFDEPIYLEDSNDFVLPDTVRLFMRQEGQSFSAYNLEDAPTYDRHSISYDISDTTCSKMTASYKSQIKTACNNYNEISGKPYYLGISVGFYVFTYSENTDLSEMIKMADNELYEAKKLRRSNVVRD